MKLTLALISIVILSVGCANNPPSAEVKRMWSPVLDSLGVIKTKGLAMKDSIGQPIVDSTGTPLQIFYCEVQLTSEKSELDSLTKAEIYFWMDSINKTNTERLNVSVLDSKKNELEWISPK
jgi:hypothetical protein